ncbi:MAG: hypothetical protein LCH86_07775 [Proteobacteria bacterium]|nr:hypothetical protein [Pseudomonadota bacterium]
MAYVRGAVLFVFVALVAAVLWYRASAISAEAEATQARASLKAALDLNREQAATIIRIRAEAAFADRLTAELADQLREVNARAIETNGAREALKGQNETVRSYLGAPVPDDLRRLYDR